MNARKQPGKRARLCVQVRLGPDYAEEIEAHFDFMPDHYFRAFKVGDMVAHVELFRRFYEATVLRKARLLRSSAGSRSQRKAIRF